jgi:hypothetical protein
MKLTKKQKGYVGVLAVALTAFVADRLFFLPAEAEAVVQEDPRELLIRPSGGVGDAAAAAALSRNQYRVDLLAERLTNAAGEHRLQLSGVRDAFLPSAAWISGPKVIVHDTAAEAAQAFRDRHRLTAIFLGPGGSTAIINGRAVREGQQIGGFTLVLIGARSTMFSAGAHQVELTLDPASSINAE